MYHKSSKCNRTDGLLKSDLKGGKSWLRWCITLPQQLTCKVLTIFNQEIKYVNHFYMVTIIGQIKPGGYLKTRTTCFIKCMEPVLLSSQGLIELGNVGVCREMICDIAKGSVNRSSSARCYICNSGYTGCDTGKQHRDDSMNTLEQ